MVQPSLNAVRTFEVAARHLNFARAARELGVQPPAVSRQIAELEHVLGVKLFVRSKPRLGLTNQGQELFHSVSIGLNEIKQGCDHVRRKQNDNTVTVITSISFTSCWLLSRLVGFYERHPEIDLQLTTRDNTINLDPHDVDIAIVFGEEDNLPGVEHTNIFREKLITVCNPKLLKGSTRFSVDELLTQSLLHYVESPHRNDWKHLLKSADVEAPLPSTGKTFNSYIVYLQAAINGIGIALGWEHLLDDYLDNGNLRRASALRLQTNRGYFCCLTETGMDKPAALQFRDWVCALASSE